MPQVPLYEQASANRPGQPFAPSGLYFLAGHMTSGRFVRNRADGPLKTRQQWQAIDAARAPQPPRRKVSLTAAIDAALTKDVPPPPTLRDIVNYQRAQVGGELLPAPAPALRSNSGAMSVPEPPRTLERVVALQRQQGTRPPADVRTLAVPSNPNHRQGQCWACHMPESQCYCPSVAPLVVNHTPAPRREPEPMLCRHCRRSSCICQIELQDTMARVVARQKELRAFTQ